MTTRNKFPMTTGNRFPMTTGNRLTVSPVITNEFR